MATRFAAQFVSIGREVQVEYAGDPHMWMRIVLGECPGRLLTHDGLGPYTDTASIYWIMTSDFDLYPEEMAGPPVLALMGTRPYGTTVVESGLGRITRLNRVYAFSPLSTPAAFAQAMSACQAEN
ncbi:unnamed protein product [Prorocentrum cordatum]|uniref:Uncharacterized protein n=1 Tax=Prorocentrum cordatum TaxID=2364126 RepID=A0ABN9U9C9_9DINO|nr:unnamed protein product [Polarella glacialis]